MRLNDKIKVNDKKDGRVYDCKVVKIKANRVRIHFVNWRKTRDEWLDMTDPRIVSGSAGNSRAISLEPTTSLDSRTSIERQIDELHRTICSQPVGDLGNVGRTLSPDQPVGTKRK